MTVNIALCKCKKKQSLPNHYLCTMYLFLTVWNRISLLYRCPRDFAPHDRMISPSLRPPSPLPPHPNDKAQRIF